MVMFQKIWRDAFKKTEIWYQHGERHTYIQGNAVKIRTQVHRILNGRSMTAKPPVLSPSIILPPPFSHCLLKGDLLH
jgi:hypothetical protein